MMEYQQQLKLQAYLDGELSDAEARQVAERAARDEGAAALLAELRQTGEALSGFEAGVKLPESREFYWSKIQAEISRESSSAHGAASGMPWLAWLRRFLVPVTGLALVVGFGLVGLRNAGGPHGSGTVTSLEDVQAFTYHDFSAGATLVWLSYPADNRIAGEDEVAILE